LRPQLRSIVSASDRRNKTSLHTTVGVNPGERRCTSYSIDVPLHHTPLARRWKYGKVNTLTTWDSEVRAALLAEL
jgi:hypothetical protein